MYDRSNRFVTLIGYTSGTTGSQNTVYAYNKSGLQTRVTYPDDNPVSGDRSYVVYAYDTASGGRLTRINHQDNTDTDIVYDSMMRLTREAQSVKQSAARNVDYAYDQSSNILTLTYPNGSAIENTLDSLSRASTLASYTYVGDRLKTQTYEIGVNDVTLTATYDGASGGRLTRLAYTQTNNTTLPDFSYGYTDPAAIPLLLPPYGNNGTSDSATSGTDILCQ